MAFFNVFPLGSLPVTDELRASCRAVSSACDDSSFTSLIRSLAVLATRDSVVVGTRAAAAEEEGSKHVALSRLMPVSARAAAADALMALLIDFARCGTAIDALPPALEERGLSPGKATAFATVFSEKISDLRAAAESSGESFE